jgi:hypothetical protein
MLINAIDARIYTSSIASRVSAQKIWCDIKNSFWLTEILHGFSFAVLNPYSFGKYFVLSLKKLLCTISEGWQQ